MKLPRRPIGTSILPTLRSDTVLSPEVAARTALARGEFLQEIGNSATKVFAHIAEVQAEQELTHAVTDLENAFTKTDIAMHQRPVEVDEDGQVVMDVDSMLEEESELRQQAISKASEAIDSPKARREFDRYVANATIKRNEQYAKLAMKRRVEVLGAQALKRSDDAAKVGNYAQAEQEIYSALASNLITQYNANEEVTRIKKARAADYVFSTITTPTFDTLNEALTAVETGHFPDGSSMEIDPQTRAQYKAALLSKMDGFEREREAEIKENQFQSYVALRAAQLRGEAGPDDFIAAAQGGFIDKSMFDTLLSNRDESNDDVPQVLGNFQERIAALSIDSFSDDWNRDRDLLINDIMRSDDLQAETKLSLVDNLQGRTTKITQHEIYKRSVQQAYESIVGFDESKLVMMFDSLTSTYDDMQLVAREFQKDVYRKAMKLGPGKMEELDDWVQDAMPKYRLDANQKMLNSVGVNVEWPKEGAISVELKEQVRQQMLEWYAGEAEALRGEEAISTIDDTMEQIERLTGIRLLDPVPQNQRL